MSSGCTTCSGDCCRQYLVHVSGRDAVTIARGQGLALEQFVDVVPPVGAPGTGFTLDASGTMYGLALRRHGDGACTFLVELTDGSYRCGIYPHRPLTCAVFPLRLYRGSVDIRPDVICEPSGRRITTVDLPQARAQLVRAGFEWAMYARVVAAWNAVRSSRPERIAEDRYFAYVVAVYDALDAALAELPPATRTAAVEHWMDGVPSDDVTAARAEIERALEAAVTPLARIHAAA